MSETRPRPTREESRLAALYQATILRYQMIEDLPTAVALMSVRLRVLRHGFDNFIDQLVSRGTAWMAERCRREMTKRQEYFAHMFATYPIDDEKLVEENIETLATDLAAIDSPAGALYLIRYLDRLRVRELKLKVHDEQKSQQIHDVMRGVRAKPPTVH